MEQPTANNQDTFIERVRLQGYKSIEDVDITFKPGLNILIGANGSGKTNFVRFLDMVLEKKFDKITGRIQVELAYQNEGSSYFYSIEYVNGSLQKGITNLKQELLINGKKTKTASEEMGWYHVSKNVLKPIFILHGVPSVFENINNIEKVKFVDLDRIKSTTPPYFFLFVEPELSEGLQELFLRSADSISLIDLQSKDENEKLKPIIPSSYIENLANYSPVRNIRLASGYRFENVKNGKEILHVRFEFFVDGKWRPWTHLSDGTKRLVYIITEVTFANNIILLEEPELGIHPHQLSKLMDFLEAEAKQKQIILTTHSPQVLNVLPLDELDRIILVRYDKENGTKMSHLTEEEQEQARTYMEAGGLDLSDYWVHSSLEKETESV